MLPVQFFAATWLYWALGAVMLLSDWGDTPEGSCDSPDCPYEAYRDVDSRADEWRRW